MKRIWFQISILFLLFIMVFILANCDHKEKVEDNSAWGRFAHKNLEYTPAQFIKCIQEDDAEGVGLFIEVGMDPNAQIGQQAPPIIMAAAFNSKSVIQKLIQIGANVNVVYLNEVTPLLAAMLGKNSLTGLQNAQMTTEYVADTTIIKMLLDAGAYINANGYTLMMLSIRQALQTGNDFSVLKLLINSGLDVNQTPDWAKPCLILALDAYEYGLNDEALMILLKAGADPYARSKSEPKINAIELSKSQNFIDKVGRDRAIRAHRILTSAGAKK
jgi:ankyrin repeat protein